MILWNYCKGTPNGGANGRLPVLTSFLKERNYTLQLDQLLSVGSIRSSRSRPSPSLSLSPRPRIYPRLPSTFRFPPFSPRAFWLPLLFSLSFFSLFLFAHQALPFIHRYCFPCNVSLFQTDAERGAGDIADVGGPMAALWIREKQGTIVRAAKSFIDEEGGGVNSFRDLKSSVAGRFPNVRPSAGNSWPMNWISRWSKFECSVVRDLIGHPPSLSSLSRSPTNSLFRSTSFLSDFGRVRLLCFTVSSFSSSFPCCSTVCYFLFCSTSSVTFMLRFIALYVALCRTLCYVTLLIILPLYYIKYWICID